VAAESLFCRAEGIPEHEK